MWVEIGNVACRVVRCTPDEKVWLTRFLSFEDDTSRYRRRAGATGLTRLYSDVSDAFPTGLLPMVRNAGQAAGIAVETADKRVRPVQEDPGADIAWLRDYQRDAVRACVEYGRGVVWLTTGCLSGDTKVTINRGGASCVLELATVVAQLHGHPPLNRRNGRQARGWDLRIPTYSQSVDARGFLRKNLITQGHACGMNEIFALTTRDGHRIRATADHKFAVGSSWVRLGDLRPGDQVQVAWPRWAHKQAPQRRSFYEQVLHMQNHPHVQVTNSIRDGKVFRVPLHRLVADARENGINLEELIGRLVLGKLEGLRFIGPDKVVHHRDHNKRNNHPDNLEVLDEEAHARLHGREHNWENVTTRSGPSVVESIVRVGEEQTYDLSMADPMNNYLANEMVVHNSGKTEIAVALTRALPCRWLFLVRDRTLLHQAADRFEERTGDTAGRVGDDVWTVPNGSASFTAATYQTLASRIASGDPRARPLLESIQGVIADECHGVPGSQSYWTLARMQNAYYRFGLSGTPLARGDQKSLYTIAALGPVIFKLKADALIAAGVLARPLVSMRACEQETDAVTWAGVYHDLVTRSAKRNRLLVEMAKKATKPCLVFAREIDHGRELERRLIKAGLNVEFVWGESSVPVRQAAITRLVRGDIDVIVSSTVFQVGVDIPALASIVVGTGGKSVIETIQRVGRGMRTDGGRKSEFEVYDVMDRGNKMLEKHARRRAAAYSAEGYQTTVEEE